MSNDKNGEKYVWPAVQTSLQKALNAAAAAPTHVIVKLPASEKEQTKATLLKAGWNYCNFSAGGMATATHWDRIGDLVIVWV